MSILRKDSFALGFALPIFLLAATVFLSLGLVTWKMTEALDQHADRQQMAQIDSALEFEKDSRRDRTDNFAFWNDAVVHLQRTTDKKWIDDNLGPYLNGYAKIDLNFAARADGSIIFAAANDHYVNTTGQTLIGPSFESLIAELNRGGSDRKDLIAVFARNEDVIYSVGVGRIKPEDDRIAPGGPDVYFFHVKQLTSFDIDNLAKRYHLSGLTLHQTEPQDKQHAYVMRDVKGQPIAWLTSDSTQPGTTMLRNFAPWIALAALLTLILAGLVLQKAHGMVARILDLREQARIQVYQDEATGLLNRRGMQQAYAERSANGLVLIELGDIASNIKPHDLEARDEAMRIFARRLAKWLDPKKDDLVRLGDTEFVALLRSTTLESSLTRLAESMAADVRQSITVGDACFAVSARMASAMVTHGEPLNALIRRAGAANKPQ